LREYEHALRLPVLPEFGAERVSEICRSDLLRMKDKLPFV
jgi:hypothetical protein